jgi:hypothetical protein
MKKGQTKKARRATRAALAASMLAVPATVAVMPTTSYAQRGEEMSKGTTASGEKYVYHTIKLSNAYRIVGMDNGHTIYQGDDGEYFYIDPKSGDQKFVSSKIFMKYHEFKGESSGKMVKFSDGWIKMHRGADKVTIVGVDADGNTIQKDASGKMFTVDQATGDFTYQKIEMK